MRLAEMLLMLCEEKKISLSQLAKRARTPVATIHGWRTGRSVQDMDQLKRVATVLECPIHRLLYGESDPFESAIGEDSLKEIFSGDVRITLHRIERTKRKEQSV
jgi:transcriptional regulator with XRE-family HTH domain